MHKNNFDFLRLLFAILVVIHHCYPIAGVSEQDPLYYYSNHSLSFSYLGVRGFFVISGYLIFQSLFRSKNILDYLVKRMLRIYPALIVVLILSVFFCSFVYEGTWFSYFKNKSMWTYIPINLSLIKLQYAIKGVFENNPLKGAINGSLWTIIYEISMYLFIIPFLLIKNLSQKNKTYILLIVLIVLYIARFSFTKYSHLHIGALSFGQWIHFSILFMSGAFLSVVNIEKFKYRYWLLVICTILFFVTISQPYFDTLQYIIMPLMVIIIGAASLRGINSIGEKFGDVSYGVYIYGFPIQQFLMYYFSLSIAGLLLLSIPLSIFFGWLSWHLIEKNTLANKKKVYQRLVNIFNLK